MGLLAALPGTSAMPAGTGVPPGSTPQVMHSADGKPAPARHVAGCLQAGNGYLRARIRGALNLDIDWHNGEIECDGGARPNGAGIRLSFAGPTHSDGRRLRMVFGVGAAQEG
ncbi:MAG: hypothetical protein ACRETD_06080, partial [Steroidobacteraceae bacterium]